MKKIIVAILLAALALAGNEKPSPSVSVEHRAKYWRRDAENVRAQAAASAAQSALAIAVAEIQKDCGSDFNAVIDKDGEPGCEAKPEPPKAEPAK